MKPTKLQVKHELWRRGELVWKMHAVQKELHKVFTEAAPNSVLVLLLSRQTGKSFYMALMGIMQCIQQENSIVKLITDTKVHVESVFEPIFEQILSDCPEEMRPVYHKAKYTYEFPNGSKIQLAGSDSGNYERLRGQKCHLALVDEAGFTTNLKDIVLSVLIPTTTHTGGKVILASTPPVEEEHDFLQFIEEAEMNGNLVKKTIYENPLLKPEQIRNIEKQMGGKDSIQFRREYLCEIIRDENTVLFPEFTEELQKEVVREWERPPFFDCYISMDIGFQDLTAVLFGYYDFKNDKIIIEEEYVEQGKNLKLDEFTKKLLDLEFRLWTNPLTNESKVPHRVSDINPFVTKNIYDVSKKTTGTGLTFVLPPKDDKEAALNKLRVMIANKKIIINPRCKTLIRHLRHCRWKDGKKITFDRSPDNGHYDAVDALLYFTRSVAYARNPYPSHYGLASRDLFISPGTSIENSNTYDVYARIFGRKKK